MRPCASVFACFIGVSALTQSVTVFPAELSGLVGEDSISLLQTRATRTSTDPTHRELDADQDGGAGYIDNIALDIPHAFQKAATRPQHVPRAVDTMNVAVAELFALEGSVEDGEHEHRFSSSSSKLVIDQMVQDIEDKIDVAAGRIKKHLQVSADVPEDIRKTTGENTNTNVAVKADIVKEMNTIKPSANSRDRGVALQSWKPSSKIHNGEVGENHRGSASAVEDIIQRADKIAETLKDVAEATESNDSKHPGVSDSEKALAVLNETVENIKSKADKIASQLKDSAKFEDSGESTSKFKNANVMQHTVVGKAHSVIHSNSGDVRPSWSKALDDMVSTSDEAHRHSRTQDAIEPLEELVRTSKARVDALNTAHAHSNGKSVARYLEGMAHTSEEVLKHGHKESVTASRNTGSSTEIDAVKGEAENDEYARSSVARAESLNGVTKTRTKMIPEELRESNTRTSVEHGSHHLKSAKFSQHDKKFNDGESRRNSDDLRSKEGETFTAHSHSVISVKMEKLEDAFDDLDDSLCDPGRRIDFGAAKLIHSNLGGAGPDDGEENIVYQGVAAIDGAEVNLIITALTAYTPYNADKNGLIGPFGRVNLQVDSKVDLSFRFVYNSHGDDADMDPFYFSFVDLDQGVAPGSAEKVTVKGLDSYRISEDTEVLFKARGEDATTFSSSWRGGKVDNPSNPMSMNKLERDRTVTAVFSNTSSFEVTFEENGYADIQGRNFLFAGVSDLVCRREQKCALFECPEGFHLRQRAEFLVCEGRSCTAQDRDLCCFAASA